jgi:hypothetical protein
VLPAQRPAGLPTTFPANGILTGSFDAPATGFNSRPTVFNSANKFTPDCDFFTEGICLEVRNYPLEALANILNRNRPVLDTMLAEVRSQSADDLTDGITSAEERKYSYSHYYGNRKQGEDTHAHRDFAEDGGFLCPSEVRYARPQLAQTTRGSWKYIINMGEHTQTLRMERCLKPSGGCSYVSPHYKSHCIQVYNYHRLLSWDDKKGMHIDIYKIPVGCSCHIHGYAYLYPPLDGSGNGPHLLPPAFNNNNFSNNTIEIARKSTTVTATATANAAAADSSSSSNSAAGTPSDSRKNGRKESESVTDSVGASFDGDAGTRRVNNVPETRPPSAPKNRPPPPTPSRPRNNNNNNNNYPRGEAPAREPADKFGFGGFDDDAPTGFKDFQSFINQQFGERLGAKEKTLPANTGSNRRMEDAGGDSSGAESKGTWRKTNYDYHPIIDFFNDKPSSGVRS